MSFYKVNEAELSSIKSKYLKVICKREFLKTSGQFTVSLYGHNIKSDNVQNNNKLMHNDYDGAPIFYQDVDILNLMYEHGYSLHSIDKEYYDRKFTGKSYLLEKIRNEKN